MVESGALKAQDRYRVDVEIAPEYAVILEVMSKYYGIMDSVNTFLKELSHPHKNWQFIVKEARGYSLDYFHLMKIHPDGPAAFERFVRIFAAAIEAEKNPAEIKADAADNLLLLLQKVIKSADADLERFLPEIDNAFQRIMNFPEPYFFLFVKSFYQIKKLAEALLSVTRQSCRIHLLLIKYYRQTYDYWLNKEDPLPLFEKEAEDSAHREIFRIFFTDISHEQIRRYRAESEEIAADLAKDCSAACPFGHPLEKLLKLPGYGEIAEIYREIPKKLFDAGADMGRGKGWKVIFLFHIMSISGLSIIHEEALREINRTLSWLINHEKHLNIEKIIRKTFSILKARTAEFPLTALNCVLNMGRGVYQTDKSELITLYIDSVINLGFQAPMIGGVGNDWQVQVNSAHIQNIRTWLQLIELNPKYSVRLLSYLIIHLSLCGVFIKDTDLFPRDITRLLNSRIEPVYNLVKQLTRIFPAYFNDIGAEGELREVSTRIDEITHRKDVLIHFLRKQVHVESSNRTVAFMEALFCFWTDRDKQHIEAFVPPDIYEQIHSEGLYIDGIHRIFSYLGEKARLRVPDDLLTVRHERLSRLLSECLIQHPQADISPEDTERIGLAVNLYKLLRQKYDLSACSKISAEMENYFFMIKSEAFPDISRLKDALATLALPDVSVSAKIGSLLDYMELLKETILSPLTYEIREDIYKKRHFTVDIPSMYGSYHESKFDALGLTFRLESLVNVLFDELIGNIELPLITKATFHQIHACLKLFGRALKLEGISTVELDRQFHFLEHSIEIKGFSFTQYLDIFKGFAQAVKNIINDYFNNIHEENLDRILTQIPADQILPKYLPRDNEGQISPESYRHRVSEIFSRERIAHSLGLQQLDIFLTRILNTLFHQSEKLRKDHLQQLLIYDPKLAMTSLDTAGSIGIIYLGNKGLNLARLKEYGIPVPPGFIITTEVFRFREMIESYPPARENFREQIRRHISEMEKAARKTFGSPENPLLFSVRSGSSISQPGMMDTFLNVGINEEITEGLAVKTGNMWFAWDCFRRFLQCYGMSYGLKRDDFDALIGDAKKKRRLVYKRQLTGPQMKEVAIDYKQMILDCGIEIAETPFEQLLMTVKKVFDSWESVKAKTYRKIMGISDDWGTAVTVQAMVFGNLSANSGTGVFFTHNPRWSGDSLRLWGDFTVGNQGEDVVAGLVNTMPISIIQQDIEMRDTDITLESHFPKIYKALEKWANELIFQKGWSPQEMEFTFESPSVKDLHLLQTRDMAIRERKKVLTFDLKAIANEKLLGHGIGVSGGAMSGRAVFSLEEIDRWRVSEPKTSLILLRGDTVPDDIWEIYAADGLLTARGGLTSHAAVVAHRLGKTCVVGCGPLVCKEKERVGFFDRTEIRSGDYISIDGREGSIYQGFIKLESEHRDVSDECLEI